MAKDFKKKVGKAKMVEVEGGSEEKGCAASEGPMRIQYKCLVLFYVFPEIKNYTASLFPNRIIIFCLSFMYL